MPNLKIRLSQTTELPALTGIYNQAIQARQTADTLPLTIAQRQPWFDAHQTEKYPLYSVLIGQQVVGYGTLSKYRGGRPALRGVVEISYYLDKAYQGQGLGATLLSFLLNAAQQLGFKHAYALLLDNNLPSVALLEKFGFQQWGHLPNIAEMDGQICGQFIYGKML